MPPRKRAPAKKAAAPRPRKTKADREAEAAAAAAAAEAARLERARRVLALRRSGVEFPEVAKAVAVDGAQPSDVELLELYDLAVRATLPMSLDDVKRLELDRLERLITPLWTKAMGGNLEAVREISKLTKLRVAVASSRSGLVDEDGRVPGPVESATALEISVLRVGANSLASTALLLARAVDEADLGTQAHANLGRELRMQMGALRAAAGDGPVGAGEDPAAKTGTDGDVVPASRLAELRAKGAGRGKRER
jgi:hypothetical protein